MSWGSATLPWVKPVHGPSFPSSDEYPTEYRTSGVPDGGLGWWAKVDIPAGVRLRTVSIKEKTLHRFENEAELRATGWDINDAVNYGIGHKSDRGAIFYLDPGTACNHADRTRKASVKYDMTHKGKMEIWSIRPVLAGEELFIDYGDNFVSPAWYEELMSARDKIPLSQLAAAIELMYQRPGVVDMRVTAAKSPSFYVRSAKGFLEGFVDKDGIKKAPVHELNISGLGDSINAVVAAATAIEKEGLGKIEKIETSYPNFVDFGANGPIFKGCTRIQIQIKKI